MTTKAKKKPAPAVKVAPDVVIPPDVVGVMDKWAIMKALGIGERKFKQMLSTGEYPRHDFALGKLHRWLSSTHNKWLKSITKGDEDAGGQ